MDRRADEVWEKRLRKVGLAVDLVDILRERGDESGVVWTDVRLKLDADNRTGVLVVAKGVLEGTKVVAFVGASNVAEALLALYGRVRAGDLRWREDRPWTPPQG